jgi:hypothetical protein
MQQLVEYGEADFFWTRYSNSVTNWCFQQKWFWKPLTAWRVHQLLEVWDTLPATNYVEIKSMFTKAFFLLKQQQYCKQKIIYYLGKQKQKQNGTFNWEFWMKGQQRKLKKQQ